MKEHFFLSVTNWVIFQLYIPFQKLLCFYYKPNFCFFSRAVKSFQEVLWVEPGFARACEVHIRLGLMLKVHGDFEAAHKHLTLALIDATTPASFSKLESKQVHYFTFFFFRFWTHFKSSFSSKISNNSSFREFRKIQKHSRTFRYS